MSLHQDPTQTAVRRQKRSLWTDAWRRMRRSHTAVIGMILFALIVIVCFSAPLFSDYDAQIVSSVAGEITMISTLSYIGLGVQQPAPEWGSMLAAGQQFIRDQPYLTIFPGLAIVITIISLTLMGDGLRDALDPRMKR